MSLFAEWLAEMGRAVAVQAVKLGEERVRLLNSSVKGGRFFPRPRDGF